MPEYMNLDQINATCIKLCEWFKAQNVLESDSVIVMSRLMGAVLGDNFNNEEILQHALTVLVTGIIEDARAVMQAKSLGLIPGAGKCVLH